MSSSMIQPDRVRDVSWPASEMPSTELIGSWLDHVIGRMNDEAGKLDDAKAAASRTEILRGIEERRLEIIEETKLIDADRLRGRLRGRSVAQIKRRERDRRYREAVKHKKAQEREQERERTRHRVGAEGEGWVLKDVCGREGAGNLCSDTPPDGC